jgi:hypothetical protein
MAFRDQDIPFLLQDTGVPVVIGGVSGVGLLDENDQVLVSDRNGGEVLVPMTTLTVQSSAFPNMRIDTAVTVNGTNYTIRERLKTGDAALTKILLGSV